MTASINAETKLATDLKLANEKGIQLEVDAPARQWLCDHGYNQEMGARPVDRLIKERIAQPIANSLLTGSIASGSTVKIHIDAMDHITLEKVA